MNGARILRMPLQIQKMINTKALFMILTILICHSLVFDCVFREVDVHDEAPETVVKKPSIKEKIMKVLKAPWKAWKEVNNPVEHDDSFAQFILKLNGFESTISSSLTKVKLNVKHSSSSKVLLIYEITYLKLCYVIFLMYHIASLIIYVLKKY